MRNTIDARHTLALEIQTLKNKINELNTLKEEASKDLLKKMVDANKDKEEFFEIKTCIVESYDTRLDIDLLYDNLQSWLAVNHLSHPTYLSKDNWELLLTSSKSIKAKKPYVKVT